MPPSYAEFHQREMPASSLHLPPSSLHLRPRVSFVFGGSGLHGAFVLNGTHFLFFLVLFYLANIRVE